MIIDRQDHKNKFPKSRKTLTFKMLQATADWSDAIMSLCDLGSRLVLQPDRDAW